MQAPDDYYARQHDGLLICLYSCMIARMHDRMGDHYCAWLHDACMMSQLQACMWCSCLYSNVGLANNVLQIA